MSIASISFSTAYPVSPAYTGTTPYASYGGDTTQDIVENPVKTTETAENQNELTEEEKQQVQELQARDREVRAHERAHIAAGGQYVRGGANFEYQTGPDGKRYAVGGEVSIDTSEVRDNPEATIQKMQVVRKAALAPARPSAQDRTVAAQASQNEMQARQELRQEQSEENSTDSAHSDHHSTTPSRVSVYTKNGTTHSFQLISLSPSFEALA